MRWHTRLRKQLINYCSCFHEILPQGIGLPGGLPEGLGDTQLH
jgi:hypothetical protein